MLAPKLMERVAKLTDLASAAARQAAPLVTRLVIGTGFVTTGLGGGQRVELEVDLVMTEQTVLSSRR